MKDKVTTTFLYALAIVSIIGFLAIIGNTWFQIDYLSENQSALILVVLGIGLIVEGQVRRWATITRNGLTSNEIAHIVTGVVGIIALVIGFLDLFSVTSATIEVTKGIVSSIAVVIIVIETFVVK